MKTAPWQKGIVCWTKGNTAFISVVFSWDIDDALESAHFYRSQGMRVLVGGPGVHVRKREFRGIADVGGEVAEAVTRHNPDATFASRGCPVGCWFCVVPSMEGREFTLIDDFVPRPILCDNNISALPAEFQQHIVARYQESGVPLMDANSGFEPKTFDDEVFRRWEPVNRGAWRFAFDEQEEAADVERVMAMLEEVPPQRTRVYVLIGNEPVASCVDRIRRVIAWGGEPHCQPLMKLSARYKQPWVKHDWTANELRRVARWANRRLWKYVELDDYAGSRASVPQDRLTVRMFD